SRWWLGSVTDKVIQQTNCPGLVVRAKDEAQAEKTPRLQGIMLTLDGSELAEEAIPHAVAVAKALGIGVTLLRTVDPLGFDGEFPTYAQLIDELREDAMSYLRDIAERLRKEGVSA